jgi:hypothetical protein
MPFLEDDPQVLGFTFADRLFLSLNEDLDLEKANRLILGKDESATSFETSNLARLPGERFDSVERSELKRLCRSLMTAHHELRHIAQASNTTIGVLLAGTQRQLAAAMLVELADLREAGLTRLAIPLLASGSFRKAEPERCRPMVQSLALRYSAMMRQVLDLTGDSPITVGEALERDKNLAEVRPGADLGLSTALPHELPASPLRLKLRHLLEGEARLADADSIGLALRAGLPEDVAEEVMYELSADPEYTFAQELFSKLTQLGPPARPLLLFAAYELALWPALDRKNGNRWEDIQPCWRFVRICEALRKLTVPEDPLTHFADFCSIACRALGWVSPMAVMQQRVEDHRAESVSDPLLKDLYLRHRAFCEEVLRTGRLPVLDGSAEPGFFDRFMPWVSHSGGRFFFNKYPQELSLDEAGVLMIAHAIGRDILLAPNFGRSRGWHERIHRYLVRCGDWTQERLEDDFRGYLETLVTGHGNLETVPAFER